MATPGVDFFRIDRSGSTRRLLTVAGLLVAVGATAIGAHLVHRIGPDLGHLVSLAGGVTVVAGLVLGFGAMAMVVFENVYILIRADGLVCHDDGKETIIAWDALEQVKHDKTGFVVFEHAGGAPVRWYAGENAAIVRSRVEDARRKAIHGLLRSAPPAA